MQKVVRVFGAALLLVAFAHVSNASCVVDGSPPCQAYWGADAVFCGTVESITYSEDTIRLGEGEMAFDYRRRITHFLVRDAFRGIDGPLAETIALEPLPMPVTLPNGEKATRMLACDCTVRFEIGHLYVVYARHNEGFGGALEADPGHTRPIEDAADDLAYIRGLASASPGAFIYGAVTRNDVVSARDEPVSAPVRGATVHIVGMGKTVSATTDADGKYRISDLAPGDYSVRFEVPRYLRQADEPVRVTVVARGCAEVPFFTEADGRMAGTIVDAAGHPMPDMKVDLVAEDRRDSCDPSPQWAYTDAAGRYEFADIAPGRYLVGIGLDAIRTPDFAYARTYYPGTTDPKEATIITLGEGEDLDHLNLKLPEALGERIVEGFVFAASGAPAQGARVHTTLLEYPFDATGPSTVVDQNGHFSLTLFEGISYCIGAFVESESDRGHHCAKSRDLPLNGAVSGVTLVIDRAGGSSLSDRQVEREERQIREIKERQSRTP